MKITIAPQAGLPTQPETTLSVSGDTLTHDGVAFDLSSIPEGGEAIPEGDHPFVGKITRENGVIHCTVQVIYDPATAEPNQPTDPTHWIVDVTSGPVALPIVRKPEPETDSTEETEA